MSSPEEQQAASTDATAYPETIASEERALDLNFKQKDYDTFLKDSKADGVLAPSESIVSDDNTT